jgi:hypothetical protein
MPIRGRSGGLHKGNLFDTNVPATQIDKDIFTDQEVEATVAGDDLILMLDVSETPDRVKYMTRTNFVAGLMGDYITVTDNESTNENNLIAFVADAAATTGTRQLEMDGDFHYNPSTGRITATQLAGTLQTASQTNITSVGTIGTGTWEATDVGVAHGGTGASSLTANAILTGNGTSAIQAESDLLFDSNKIIPTAAAHNAAGTALSISAGATTAGTSNNQAGGALTFQGGQGKGSGAGGAIIFQVANEGSSGSSLNSLTTALTINDDGTLTTVGAIELGHSGDTTITRAGSGSGDIAIEGNIVYRAGGTTVPVADGGTGTTSLTNLITLTTHTTGNYVATVTGGVGIASTGATSGEGIAHSLSLDLSELSDTAIANGDYIVFTDTTDSNATVKGDLADVATLFAGTGLTASSSVIGVDASQTQITAVGTIATGTWEATDIGVAHGGTGASSLTDGGVLLGSGTGAVTAMAVLADGEMIVGDGTGDPVAESGATLRTSIGVAIGSDVQAYDAELTAIAGLTSAANKIPMFSGSESASLIDFKDEDTLSSNSATAVASQQSIKAYVDSSSPSEASAFATKMAIAL